MKCNIMDLKFEDVISYFANEKKKRAIGFGDNIGLVIDKFSVETILDNTKTWEYNMHSLKLAIFIWTF